MPLSAACALCAASLLWAGSFVATKIALSGAPPLAVVALRLLLAAGCFAAWFLLSGRRWPQLRGWWGRLAVLSLCGGSLHFGLQTAGLQFTTASNGAVYTVTGPVTIAVLGVVFLGERPTLLKSAGIVVAMVGVLLVMGADTQRGFSLSAAPWGDLLVLASIVLWGVFTVVGKAAVDRLGALVVTAAMTGLAALTMVPIGAAELAILGVSPVDVPPSAWAAIGFLGAGCSFGATLLYLSALTRSEAQKVGVFLYTIPPMTALIAWPLLGEVPGATLVIGAALVLVGVVLTERG